MRELWWDEEGLSTVEYSLLLTLIGLSAIVSWQGMADVTINAIEEGAAEIAGAG